MAIVGISQTEIQAEGPRCSAPLMPDNVWLDHKHEPLLSDFTPYRMERAIVFDCP